MVARHVGNLRALRCRFILTHCLAMALARASCKGRDPTRLATEALAVNREGVGSGGVEVEVHGTPTRRNPRHTNARRPGTVWFTDCHQ